MKPIATIVFACVLITAHTALADVRISGQTAPVYGVDHLPIPDLLEGVSDAGLYAGHLLIMPADGRISSGFGLRTDPITGSKRFHKGIDIANLRNASILAANTGRVVFAGPAKGCGLMVALAKGMTETRYCHLEKIAVQKGDWVETGSMIGAMGATGRATGTHLHFEVRYAGWSVDPAGEIAVVY